MIFEVCIENGTRLDELIEKKAQRVELCDNLAVGGTTVSYGVAKNVAERCQRHGISVMAMIRPRSGNFIYNDNEMTMMLDDIALLSQLNIDGFVIGALTDDHLPDYENLLILLKACGDKQVTFHMAFDLIKAEHQAEAIDWLIKHRVERILTHGSPLNNDIFENISRIKEYVAHAAGRIIIMPGGGVTAANVAALTAMLGVYEAHGTKIL
jgi:copper homeostasis protein